MYSPFHEIQLMIIAVNFLYIVGLIYLNHFIPKFTPQLRNLINKNTPLVNPILSIIFLLLFTRNIFLTTFIMAYGEKGLN